MKRLIVFSLLLFACAATAAPPAASTRTDAERAASEAAQAGDEAARAGDEATQAANEAVQAGNEAARAGDEAAHEATEAMKTADMQKRMNELARQMAELSVKIGDQANASALRYLSDSKRGMLGVVLDGDSTGLRVSAVTPDGPAERAGIRDGDLITAVDGTPLRNGSDPELAQRLAAGKPVKLAVQRDGKALQFSVTPERFQDADWQALARTAQAAAQRAVAEVNSPQFRVQINRSLEDAMKQSEKAREQIAAQWGKGLFNGHWFAPWWGLNLASLDPQLGSYFGTDRGALVLSGDAQRYPGLQAGDVITAVNERTVTGPEDAMRALQALPTGKPVHLSVLRHGKRLAVDLKTPPGWKLLPPLPPTPPAPPLAPVAPASPAPPAAPTPPPPPPRHAG